MSRRTSETAPPGGNAAQTWWRCSAATAIATVGPDPLSHAAVAPAAGEWLYYVLADESGRHTFTNTYDEFLDAKAECQAAGLC